MNIGTKLGVFKNKSVFKNNKWVKVCCFLTHISINGKLDGGWKVKQYWDRDKYNTNML